MADWWNPFSWGSGSSGGNDWGQSQAVDIGGGWKVAPGMAEAGYTTPTPAPSTDTDWGKIASALGDLSKGATPQPGQQLPQPPPVTGSAQSAGVGRPTTPSITALVQMLNARRDEYLKQAMSGHAQPVQRGETSGLLGF
jgi:hypothetical protein